MPEQLVGAVDEMNLQGVPTIFNNAYELRSIISTWVQTGSLNHNEETFQSSRTWDETVQKLDPSPLVSRNR
jgi:hypothetical protein